MKFSPRCVLFDLDGTLVDTAPDLGGAANQIRAGLGLPPLPIDIYRPQASHGVRGMLLLALQMTPDHPDFAARREQYLAFYRARLSRDSQLFAEVPEALDRLEAAGIIWGVVTNKPDWLARPLMDDLGLSARSACRVSGDTAAQPKPAADPLLYACEQIGISAERCIYVGDDIRDIQSGRAAGMPTLVAGWGYLGSGTPPQDWGADAILESPSALLQQIELRDAA